MFVKKKIKKLVYILKILDYNVKKKKEYKMKDFISVDDT